MGCAVRGSPHELDTQDPRERRLFASADRDLYAQAISAYPRVDSPACGTLRRMGSTIPKHPRAVTAEKADR